MAKATQVEIQEVKVGRTKVWLVGQMPLIYHAMSEKARRELLFPSPKKNRAAREQSMKHDPLEEYRASVYMSRDDKAPTRLVFPAGGVKAAMATAALELPGTSKAQIGRLVWIGGPDVPVYGVPQLYMAVVRNSDMNRTPDVRTRAILPEWCIPLTVNFVMPTLNEKQVMAILGTAGLIVGLGDMRQEKGKGSFGQFHLTTEESEVASIIKGGGRKAQDAALEKPTCYDVETTRLLEWFLKERKDRGRE